MYARLVHELLATEQLEDSTHRTFLLVADGSALFGPRISDLYQLMRQPLNFLTVGFSILYLWVLSNITVRALAHDLLLCTVGFWDEIYGVVELAVSGSFG